MHVGMEGSSVTQEGDRVSVGRTERGSRLLNLFFFNDTGGELNYDAAFVQQQEAAEAPRSTSGGEGAKAQRRLLLPPWPAAG